MICRDCCEAADRQAGREAHCDADGAPDAACCCQHRTNRYRTHEEPACTSSSASSPS